MHRFTAEFGMGSGGSNALWSSRNSVAAPFARGRESGYVMFVMSPIFGVSSPPRSVLTQIAWVLYGQASRAISMG